MKSLGPSIIPDTKWDVQCSTTLPTGASSPERLSVPWEHCTWEAMPLTLPTEPQLSPKWPSDRKLHLGMGGWPQEARAGKSHCSKTKVVISLLSLDFMAAEIMLDARAVAISFFSRSLALLFFSSFPILEIWVI